MHRLYANTVLFYIRDLACADFGTLRGPRTIPCRHWGTRDEGQLYSHFSNTRMGSLTESLNRVSRKVKELEMEQQKTAYVKTCFIIKHKQLIIWFLFWLTIDRFGNIFYLEAKLKFQSTFHVCYILLYRRFASYRISEYGSGQRKYLNYLRENIIQ